MTFIRLLSQSATASVVATAIPLPRVQLSIYYCVLSPLLMSSPLSTTPTSFISRTEPSTTGLARLGAPLRLSCFPYPP